MDRRARSHWFIANSNLFAAIADRQVCMIARWLVVTLLLAGCGGGGAQKFNGVDITGAKYARDFALTDHTGAKRTLADYRGKVVAIFFGFTQCSDVCPTTQTTWRRSRSGWARMESDCK